MPENTPTFNTLYEAIDDHFNVSELNNLCFDLNIKYDNLPGEGTPLSKARGLVEYVENRGQKDRLIARLQELRPHVEWSKHVPSEPNAKSPFKGLHYFTENDAHLFFGREQLTAELVEHLRQHRFLAVVGASGSGKSSLVRAGLIPAIRAGAIELNGESSATWPIHLITPRDAPLKELALSLTRDSESVTAGEQLQKDLGHSHQSLDLYLRRQMSGQPQRCLLLVVDQFEELFTQCDDLEERRLFVENLVNAVQSGTQGRLSLIITLRADFYAYAVQYEGLRPLLETRQKIVGAMNADELCRAIEVPAKQGNWLFQPGLVETILQDVGREPGALPLLSHALQETWSRREGRVMTLVGYQGAGGVRRAIAQTADNVYATLAPSQQTIVRNIFLRLTELGESTEDTRRRAGLNELLPHDNMTDEVQAILDLLARKRLLILNEEHAKEGKAQNYAEVAHEALIREWPALRGWLDENREGLRLHRQLTNMAEAWQNAREDPGYLYRGGRLEQIQEWIDRNPLALNDLENHFLAASQQAARQEELRRQKELENARKIRRATWGILILFVIAVGAALFGFAQSGIAQDNLATAIYSEQIAMTREAEAVRQSRVFLAQSLASQALQILDKTNNTELATLLAIEAAFLNRDTDGSIQELVDSTLYEILDTPYFNVILEGHEGWVNSVAFSPDGKWLASAGTDTDPSVRIWNLTDLSTDPIVLARPDSLAHFVAFSPDSQTLVTGGVDHKILLWNIADLAANPTVLYSHDSRERFAAFSPDGQTLATAGAEGTISLWDMADLSSDPVILTSHTGSVNSIAFNPNGEILASAGNDWTIRIWNLDNPSLSPTLLVGHEGPVWSVAFSPDGTRLVSGSSDRSIRLWDITNDRSSTIVFTGHNDWVTAVSFSLDGEFLASASVDRTVRLWSINKPGVEPTILTGHTTRVTSLAFSPDGQTLATASYDRTIRLWSVGKPRLGSVALRDHENIVNTVAFSPDGQTLASASYDFTIRLWNLANVNTSPFIVGKHQHWVTSVAFSPDGQFLASASFDGTVRLWNVNDLKIDSVILSIGITVYSVAFSPDNSILAASSADGFIRLWNLADLNTPPIILEGHERGIRSIAFSPDGRILASASDDETIRLWDMKDLSVTPTILVGHQGNVGTVAFSPNGQLLASGSNDRTVRLWNLDNVSTTSIVLFGHDGTINSVVFSPDGQFLTSSSVDQTIRLWRINDPPSTVLVLKSHDDIVYGLAFSPNGQPLASGSADQTVRLWIIDMELLLEAACQKVHRNLTWEEWQRYLVNEPYRQTCPELPIPSITNS